jgi:serine O-acetyltransferase
VVVGSNATILGPVRIGDGARVGSGAVVIDSVPEDSTAVGVPARVVRGPHLEPDPCVSLAHSELPDPVAEQCRRLSAQIQQLELGLQAVTEALREVRREPAPSGAPLEGGNGQSGERPSSDRNRED